MPKKEFLENKAINNVVLYQTAPQFTETATVGQMNQYFCPHKKEHTVLYDIKLFCDIKLYSFIHAIFNIHYIIQYHYIFSILFIFYSQVYH